MRSAVNVNNHRVALALIEPCRFQYAIIECLAVFGLKRTEFDRRSCREVGVIRVRLIEPVLFDVRDARSVCPVQAELRRRDGAVEAVDVEFAVVGKVCLVPAGLLANAARLDRVG
jgi:hypothetical protein